MKDLGFSDLNIDDYTKKIKDTGDYKLDENC
jgi:hypothetical protein